MREVRIKESGLVISEVDYRNIYPLTTFAVGNFFKPNSDADVVKEVSPPVPRLDQNVVRDGVELFDNVWRQRWTLVPKSTAEIATLKEKLKADKVTEINDDWLKANKKSFFFKGKEIAVDEIAHQSIASTNGYIALFNEFQENWPGGWKAIDNSYIAISTITEWKEFYKAMVRQGQTHFAYAQMLKAKVANAITIDQITGIKWGVTQP